MTGFDSEEPNTDLGEGFFEKTAVLHLRFKDNLLALIENKTDEEIASLAASCRHYAKPDHIRGFRVTFWDEVEEILRSELAFRYCGSREGSCLGEEQHAKLITPDEPDRLHLNEMSRDTLIEEIIRRNKEDERKADIQAKISELRSKPPPSTKKE
jgi:hypothetical protein